jgi:hypothetical protein
MLEHALVLVVVGYGSPLSLAVLGWSRSGGDP